mmetsp:Transcript_93919/g.265658  ORF Transcript_93919/g.265658 Transcript_93919/m.265658 type:complete len:222 (+) Transcript_93919:47-712(+)
MEAINRVLRKPHLRQSGASSSSRLTIPAASLPSWVEVGHTVCYVSKTNSSVTHHVKIQKIEERQQSVLIRFEIDKKVWKRVPFSEISKLGDGSLRPLWKPEPAVSTVPERPKEFEQAKDDAPEAGHEDEREASAEESCVVAAPAEGPPPQKAKETGASSSAAASAEPAVVPDGDSEEERQAQMERRMRRKRKADDEKEADARTRSPPNSKKPWCYTSHGIM